MISRGRLEIGFVKSGGSEMASGNTNPVGNLERFWEAIDLITIADEPRRSVQLGGKYFAHRHANVWPRAWQAPHPPFWAASSDEEPCASSAAAASSTRCSRAASSGPRKPGVIIAGRRMPAAAAGPDRFAYMGFTYVGETDEEAQRIGKELLWFLDVGDISAPQYSKFLPGAYPPRVAPNVYRSMKLRDEIVRTRAGPQATPRFSMEKAIAQGTLFVGNPDTVYRQIINFYDKVGGFEHLILMGRSGFMTHEGPRRASGCSHARCCRGCARRPRTVPCRERPCERFRFAPAGSVLWRFEHLGLRSGHARRFPRDVRWTGVLAAMLGDGYEIIEEGLRGRTIVFDDPLLPDRNGSRYSCHASSAISRSTRSSSCSAPMISRTASAFPPTK